MSNADRKIKPDSRYCTPEELQKRWDGAFGEKESEAERRAKWAELRHRQAMKGAGESLDEWKAYLKKKGRK